MLTTHDLVWIWGPLLAVILFVMLPGFVVDHVRAAQGGRS